jgi:8-oxo-dGTP pyrophosphatase MutT (NUDIX family)
LLVGSEAPFSRDQFTPGHFTASAVVLSPDQDALLLIHHTRLQRWLQPGGHVEPADGDLALAARREVAEETGLLALDAPFGGPGPFDLDVHRIPATGTTPEHLHFDVRFLFRARSNDLTPASDVNEARWVPFTSVDELNSEASITRMTLKLRNLLASESGSVFRGEP